MITTVWATCEFEGVHQWEGVTKLKKDQSAEVKYLQHPHRHMFHVHVEVRVFADDREVEFQILKRRIKAYCDRVFGWPKNGVLSHSCESMAKIIFNYVERNVTESVVFVTVSEDGECGATVRG